MSFKGRLLIKQYIPLKPTKHGIKFFAICDDDIGYCLNIYVYSTTNQQLLPGNGFTFNICTQLMRIFWEGHDLYTYRLYTSVKLTSYLFILIWEYRFSWKCKNNIKKLMTIAPLTKKNPMFHMQIIPPRNTLKIASDDRIIVLIIDCI